MSVLSVVSKILEKSVYIQLEEYLVNKNLLFDFQSGFRNRYSTDTCLTYLTDYIKTQTSKGLYTGMIMLITIFFAKKKQLRAMGVMSVDWFRSLSV